ncbi:histone deacetylase [bacterium SCSIO 12741]|nr:histone deacetylase [bacterium SCSIO 12741]
MHIAYHPIYVHPVPTGHRFPMEKYELIQQQLLREGVVSEDQFFEPGILHREDAIRVHTPEYWETLTGLQLSKAAQRKTGFIHNEVLIERERTIMQGTLEAASWALKDGVSFNIAGGTHHAYSDRGEGFCLLNDFAIAAAWLLEQELVSRVLIVDLDVHQGNGTAEIFRNDPRVFTFSMHGKNNYPLKKERSDLDIALEDQTTDREFLDQLNQSLEVISEVFQPEFVFYQSGVDVLESDKLGRLNLSMEGCRQRDDAVIRWCYSHDLPLVVSMGGGYSEKVSDIVNAHIQVYRLARDIYT